MVDSKREENVTWYNIETERIDRGIGALMFAGFISG